MSGTQETLKAAMRESLEANGTMSQIKAQLRAAIFQSLSEATSSASTAYAGDGTSVSDDQKAQFPSLFREFRGAASPPPPPPENYLINELIKEYLAFNGLEHTLATFQLEARVLDSAVPRRVLATELKLRGAPADVPLLYSMLNECRQAIQ